MPNDNLKNTISSWVNELKGEPAGSGKGIQDIIRASQNKNFAVNAEPERGTIGGRDIPLVRGLYQAADELNEAENFPQAVSALLHGVMQPVISPITEGLDLIKSTGSMGEEVADGLERTMMLPFDILGAGSSGIDSGLNAIGIDTSKEGIFRDINNLLIEIGGLYLTGKSHSAIKEYVKKKVPEITKKEGVYENKNNEAGPVPDEQSKPIIREAARETEIRTPQRRSENIKQEEAPQARTRLDINKIRDRAVNERLDNHYKRVLELSGIESQYKGRNTNKGQTTGITVDVPVDPNNPNPALRRTSLTFKPDEFTPENIKLQAEAKMREFQGTEPPTTVKPSKTSPEARGEAISPKPIEYQPAIERMLNEGKKPEDIADALKVPVKEVSEIKNQRVGSLKPIEGTGETKQRGLSKSTEAAAIQAEITKGIENLPEYNVRENAPQIQKASELIANDTERAIRIATGTEKSPNDILPGFIYIGLRDKALKGELKPEVITQLAQSDWLAKQGTTAGQIIQSFRGQDVLDPIKAISDIKKAREETYLSRNKRADIKPVERVLTDQIRKSVRRNNLQFKDWNQFIKSIECV